MVITDKQLELYFFIKNDLECRFSMTFIIDEHKIVTGTLGNEQIQEAITIRFFPDETIDEWCEDKIIAMIDEYLQKNRIPLYRTPTIEREVCDKDRIRYGITYTGGE